MRHQLEHGLHMRALERHAARHDHADVARAEDDDLAAGHTVVQVHVRLRGACGKHAGGPLARNAERHAVWLACGGDDGAVLPAERGDVGDGSVEAEIDMAVAADAVPVAHDDVAGEPFLRDHVEGAADFSARFEQDDADAPSREQGGGGNARRAGADDGDGGLFLLRGGGRQRDVAVFLQQGRLDFRDVDRKIDGVTRACFHAEFVGANETACLPERIVARNGRDSARAVA